MCYTSKSLAAFLLTIMVAVGGAHGQATIENRDDVIAKKLDEISKRLEKIENRLSKLEANAGFNQSVDEHGLLPEGKNKPQGYWGIDSIHPRVRIR